ncbi:peptidase domain-containing ABC transporter [Nonomuraea mesophila]
MLQSTAVECGVACLAMVLSYYGRYTSIAEIRDAIVLGRDGVSAGAIVRQARKLGMEVRAVRAEPSALDTLFMPLIVHWNMNHFIVVERITADFVEVVDPGAGRQRLSQAEFGDGFTGVALELLPTVDLARRSGGGMRLWTFVRPFLPPAPKVVTIILAASLGLTLLGLVPALVIGYLLDHVLPTDSTGLVHVLAAGMLAYALGYALVSLARAELLLWMQTRIDWSMMVSFVRHLMSLPYQFFQLRRGGDLLVRVSSSAYVRDVVSSQLLAIAIDSALLGVYMLVIGVQSWTYVLVIAVLAIGQLAVMVVSAPHAQRYTERELQATGEAQSTLLETVTAAETVKSTGAEDIALARWSGRFADQLAASLRRRRLDNAIDALLSAVAATTPLLMLLVGAYLVLGGHLSVGEMFALNAMAGAALAPVTKLGGSIKSLQTVRVHLDRLRDIFDERTESACQGREEVDLNMSIKLSRVSFQYAGDAPAVLSDIDLSIQPSQMVAIVGQTGSGKSTLARLILGLYPPTTGDITFDGVSLSDLELRRFRRQCGVVTQSADIFSGSILANIALVASEATMADVIEAAKMAEVHDDIMRMPMGYETVLGEGGNGLSGGQRQRVALARALVARPKILLLDEATSNLDADTEMRVQRNLNALRCTRIVIAHRLSTIKDSDRILVLRDGRVVESGDHAGLLERNGHYAHLVGRQLVG